MPARCPACNFDARLAGPDSVPAPNVVLRAAIERDLPNRLAQRLADLADNEKGDALETRIRRLPGYARRPAAAPPLPPAAQGDNLRTAQIIICLGVYLAVLVCCIVDLAIGRLYYDRKFVDISGLPDLWSTVVHLILSALGAAFVAMMITLYFFIGFGFLVTLPARLLTTCVGRANAEKAFCAYMLLFVLVFWPIFANFGRGISHTPGFAWLYATAPTFGGILGLLAATLLFGL